MLTTPELVDVRQISLTINDFQSLADP